MHLVPRTAHRLAVPTLILVCGMLAGGAAVQPSQAAGPFGVFRNRSTAPDTLRSAYLGTSWSVRLMRPIESKWWQDGDNTNAANCGAGMDQIFTLTTAPGDSLNAYFPTSLTAWADSVSRVVERYDGDGYLDMPGLACPTHHWHVEAEDTFWKGTTDEYLAYLAITRAAILGADPTAKVITLGLSSSQVWNAAYNTGFVKLDPASQLVPASTMQRWLLKAQRIITEGSYDILDLHAYESDNVQAGKMQWVRSLLPADREVWILEMGGGYTTREGGYSDTLNAQVTVETYVEALANGVGRLAAPYLGPSPATFSYTEQMINVSLTRYLVYPSDVETKPSFETYALMTDKLEGFTSATDVSDRSGPDERSYLYDMRFQTPRGQVDVVWTPTGVRTVEIPLSTASAKITHIITRAGFTKDQAVVQYAAVTGGMARITVTDDPVFIEGSSLPLAMEGGNPVVSGPATLKVAPSLAVSRTRIAWPGTTVFPVGYTVTSVAGTTVRRLASTAPEAAVEWDLRDATGSRVPGGVYFLCGTDARGQSRIARLVVAH